MNQLLQNSRNGEFSITSVPMPALYPEGVLVRTACSLISAGTEKTSVRTAQASLVGKARSRPDLVRQVVQHAQRNGVMETIQLVKDRLDVPLQLGYAAAGVVTERGSRVHDLEVGDWVACAGGGFATHAETNYIPNNLAVKLPGQVSFAQGAYATLGAVALQGVRQSGAVVGDKVAVIGLGLIGQLTVQILKAAGCQVLAVDISDFTVQLAANSQQSTVISEQSTGRDTDTVNGERIPSGESCRESAGSGGERANSVESTKAVSRGYAESGKSGVESEGAKDRMSKGLGVATAENGRCDIGVRRNSAGLADSAVNSQREDVTQHALAFTDGHGVDKVVITAASKDNQPLLQAGEIIRDRGTIVIVGAVPVDIPRSPFYDKEIDFKFSRSYGPGRYDAEYEEKGRDYPIGYVRWTERRNMEAFLQLVAAGRINLEHLTTHRFKLQDAPRAYEMILKGSEPYLGILIDYDYPGPGEKTNGQLISKNGWRPEIICESVPEGHDSTVIGFIGAGKFAQSFLLPHIKGQAGTRLKTVVNTSGVTAERGRTKNDIQRAATNPQEIFEDDTINTVFIASRHNSHAEYVLKAARARKHVFVEKPLCLTREELNRIEATYVGRNKSVRSDTNKSEIRNPKHVVSAVEPAENHAATAQDSKSGLALGEPHRENSGSLSTLHPRLGSSAHPPSSILMVGYNRRFAPLSLALSDALTGRTRPLSILYRVNAGLIDRKHWIQDPEIGGGRILGEVCHFIDYTIFLTGSRVTSVYATSASYNRVDIPNEDSVHITLRFEDGSVATIQYLCDGDRAVAKEWIEVMVDQATFQLDDFRSGWKYRNGKRQKLSGSSRRQNKGYEGEIQAYFDSIKGGGPPPIPVDEIFHGMDVTFLVRESLGSGQVVRVGQRSEDEVITVASAYEKPPLENLSSATPQEG